MVLDLLITVVATVAVAGSAIGLYHRHRAWGLGPLVFLVISAALILPATVGLAPTDHALLGPADQAAAIAAPALIAMVLLIHALAGRRNAISAALTPVLAGLLLGLATLAWSGTALLGATGATGIVMAGAAATLGALAAAGAFELVGRVPRARVLVRTIPAGLAGVALYGLTVTAAWHVGIDAGFAAWPSSVTVPLAASLLPTVLVGLYADHRTVGLGYHAWEALAEQPAFGATDGLDRVRHREDRLKRALHEGHATAEEHIRLLDSQPVAAFICQPDGTITYANPAMARLLDRHGETLAGRNVIDLLGDQDARGRPRFATELKDPGRHRITMTTAKGRARMVEVQVQLGAEGRRLGHVTDLGPLGGSNGHGSDHEPAVTLSEGGGDPGRIP